MPVRIRRVRLIVAAAVAAVALTGCESSTNENPTPPGGTSVSPLPSSQAPTKTNAGAPGVPEAAAKALCDAMRPELSNWRVQGGTLGKPGLNLLVQQWAAENGALNIDVLRDRTLIDKITTESCPDVRQQAIEALGIPDLASGLVGF